MADDCLDRCLVAVCTSGELAEVDRLLAEGADACLPDDAGVTPLMVGSLRD